MIHLIKDDDNQENPLIFYQGSDKIKNPLPENDSGHCAIYAVKQ
jgi:hypothetical protein